MDLKLQKNFFDEELKREVQMSKQLFYSFYDCSIGTLLLIGDDDGLHRLHFPNENAKPPKEAIEKASGLGGVTEQLDEYFAGSRQVFDLKLKPIGTSFQKRVWLALAQIPYGQTTSYGELARRVGSPKGARAVGAANGKNPLPIILPCHRVIGKDGSLTGFGGGLELKTVLLDLERRNKA